MASSSYRPQSPDLSGLQRSQAFSGYTPQSPDLSGLGAQDANQQHEHSSLPRQYLAGDSDKRYGAQSLPRQQKQQTSDPYSSYQYSQPQHSMPPAQSKQEDLGYLPDASMHRGPSAQAKTEANDPTLGVVLKTSFPVARIKRIMQADEDIGKVAQVTPHVVSRALELFMIKLITASCEQARGPANSTSKGPKRVLTQHMKKAIQADEKFDFLAEIVSRVPDAPGKPRKDAGSDSEDVKPKKKSKRRKDDE